MTETVKLQVTADASKVSPELAKVQKDLGELRAILTRAATVEAERQRARDRRDWPAEAQAERELRQLWRRHSELERCPQCA